MPLRSIWNAAFVLALLMPLFSIHAFAQSGSATLEGTVTDPTGSVVPNATVTITSEETGTERQVTSNQSGIYSAPDLPAASYKVSTSATGFGTREVEHIVLTVGAVRDVDVQLLVGGTETRVTVEASVNTVDTATSAVQGVVDGKQTRDLPLNGRDWTTLAALQPGVSSIATQFASTVTATTRLNRGLGNQVTIGGNRPQQNAYRLDGVIINDYANGSPGSVSGVTLGVYAVQEFSVITSNAPAAYGRSSGGVINSITRSGTNDFHGSFYDYLRNSVFDARNFFDPGPVPSFRRNQFGVALGGPILKDKTFFFLNYEGFRQSLGTTLIDVVPSLSARQGPVDPKVAPYLGLYNLPNS
ncbi:MAG: TonB-dependent receptor, partial [Acidobacteriaceae bacterium]|nr:TonB-dependent receptor [Acidobacteriaceae bacterium]